MNRTQKYTAAGIAAVVILAIIAMVALTPNLHTQTPVSTAPPTSGGTGNGGNGTSGATGGAGNSTAPTCNVTGDDHEWDGHNETDGNWSGNRTWDDGNRTNETEDHDWGACNATAGDHDGNGDQASDGHHGHGEDDLVGMAIQGALALAPVLTGGFTAVSSAAALLSGFLVRPFAGPVLSGVFL